MNPTRKIYFRLSLWICTLALGLADANLQADVIGRYFRKWRSTDNSSAQQWISSEWNNLPPGLQRKLSVEQKL